MNTYNLHINAFDPAFLGAIFTGLTIAVFLWFAKRTSRAANRFLALALVTVMLEVGRLLGNDIGLSVYLPSWNWLPLQFSLATGPLIYFYVLKTTRPEFKFRRKDWLHFIPLLLELFVQVTYAAYNTPVFHRLIQLLQLPAFVSVAAYLYLCHTSIEHFYDRQKFSGNDRHRYELRWLHNLIKRFGLLWLLWIPFTAIEYFYYHHHELVAHVYYPLSLLLAVMITWITAAAFLKSENDVEAAMPSFPKPLQPADLKQKGIWLKKAVKAGFYYQDPELSLNSLAEKLGLSPHELSRIVNTILKKSFNDFINEYRVADVIRKMLDPAYDRLNHLGIAYDSGFNSKSAFHRIFKEHTGKSPAEYKAGLKKEFPSYNLGQHPQSAAVISYQQTTPKWFEEKLNRIYMFRNYLRNAWRHIMRHKTYSAINVMGLALGICGCLVIYLVASFEFSFDTFHPGSDRVYCVDISNASNPDPRHAHWNTIPAPMPAAMRNDITGLEKVAAFTHYRPKVKIKAGNRVIKSFDRTEGIIAEADYFDILPYTWLSGSKTTSLANPMTVVLTQSRARTYFGDLRPDKIIGKTVTYDDSLTVTVTGILKDWDKNSDFNFSDFISHSTIDNSFLKNQIPQGNWHILDGDNQVLIKLPANVNPSQIDKQFPSFIKKYIDDDPHTGLHAQLQPFAGIHFHREYGGPGNKADLRILYILSAVAIFILIIAAINFINLSTAQSIQRTKDIGILKVLGSGRGGILFQFLTETFILALLAVVIAVIAVQPLLNMFASDIPPGVEFHFADYTAWIFLAGIAIFTTLLAGFYPAKLLSAFKPVASLKGETNSRTGNKSYLRKSLIVFQFTISLLFITGSIVVNQQVSYMQNIDLGVKSGNIITLRSLFRDETGKMKVLAEKIKQLPGIEQVITEDVPPIGFRHGLDPIKLPGGNSEFINSFTYAGNENFVPFYSMKIVAGRNLLHADSATEYLINETAAKALGFTNPQKAVGRLLKFSPADNKPYPIAGVVADFHESTFYEQIMPCIIANIAERQKAIALKLSPAEYQKGNIPMLINNIAKEWKKVYPEEPFEYSFLGDSIARLYENEQRTKWLMSTATFITIFISCMGLFGLAMFTTQRRTKEISIRKVLGASVANILTMLNREVVVLIAVSLLISSPIAWIFIHKWLQNFAYHTNLSFWVFVLAGVGAILIALVTISFQTIKSAAANPVKGLRNE